MEHISVLDVKIDKNKVEVYLESLDTAILELITEKMNKYEDLMCSYIEEHPLTNRYKLIVVGKEAGTRLKKTLEELSNIDL